MRIVQLKHGKRLELKQAGADEPLFFDLGEIASVAACDRGPDVSLLTTRDGTEYYIKASPEALKEFISVTYDKPRDNAVGHEKLRYATMKIKGPGEFKMRNGLRAWVKFRRTGYNGTRMWVGEKECTDGTRNIEFWSDYGEHRIHMDSPYDLMPPEESLYYNICRDSGGFLVFGTCRPTYGEARAFADHNSIGILKCTTCGDQTTLEIVEPGSEPQDDE